MKNAFVSYFDSLSHYMASFGGLVTSLALINIQVILVFVKNYVFGDIEFLVWYSVLMFWDTVFGTWAALRTQLKADTPFSFFRFVATFFDKIITKIVITGGLLSIGYVLSSHRVMGERNMFYTWAITIFYAIIIGKEANSALGHIVSMGKDWGWVSKLITKLKEVTPTILADKNATRP